MPDLRIKPNDRVALVGKTTSGKTFAARLLLSDRHRLMACDPKGTLGRSKGQEDWNLEEWSDKARRRLLKGNEIRVRIPPPSPKLSGKEITGYWEQFFQYAYDAGNIVVYIDEMYGVLPRLGAPPTTYLNAIYTRGRELGIGVWAASQRPAWIPRTMLSEAETFFMFRLLYPNDRKLMAQIMGPAVLNDVRDEHGFWLYNVAWNQPVYIKSIVRKAA